MLQSSAITLQRIRGYNKWMDCEKRTFDILDIQVCAKTGICCLQLQGNCDPSGWLVDEGHQSLGCQGYMEGEDPER